MEVSERREEVISKSGGFVKGEAVEFLSYQHVWIRGTVMAYEPAEKKVEGPGGTIVEKSKAKVHIKYFSAVNRGPRVKVFEVPSNRVRACASS